MILGLTPVDHAHRARVQPRLAPNPSRPRTANCPPLALTYGDDHGLEPGPGGPARLALAEPGAPPSGGFDRRGVLLGAGRRMLEHPPARAGASRAGPRRRRPRAG